MRWKSSGRAGRSKACMASRRISFTAWSRAMAFKAGCRSRRRSRTRHGDGRVLWGVIFAVTMLPFKLVYSDDYYLPIGAHVFPAEKYERVHNRLIETGVAEVSDFLTPQPASDEDILLVHTPLYVQKLKTGTLSPREELELEIPYSPELVRAFWLAAGGSILAADRALKDRVAVNLGGGFHHAFPDHGEGFCMIHDVAVAIRRMQRDHKITRAMTVDCDVHQGNGTAAIFAGTRIPTGRLPSTSASTLNPAASAKVR